MNLEKQATEQLVGNEEDHLRHEGHCSYLTKAKEYSVLKSIDIARCWRQTITLVTTTNESFHTEGNGKPFSYFTKKTRWGYKIEEMLIP